jgi:hypothetical protein
MTVEELKVALAGPWPPTAKDFAYEITFRGQILRKSEMFGRASELVSDVEVRLRNVVAYKLEAVAGPKWLKQRSGSAIFGRVTQLKAAAVKRGTVDVRPLAYATLGELKEIIIRRDNWSECFSEVFGDQDDFRLNLGRLIFLRNEVAHSRPIAHDEFVELLTVSKRIIRLINADSSRRRAAELLQAIIG